jgi:hypothetical protein
VSGKKFCCCLIKGEKTKQTNKQTTKKNPKPEHIKTNPKFKCNTISVCPSTFSPTSVIVSSKDEKNNKITQSLEIAL